MNTATRQTKEISIVDRNEEDMDMTLECVAKIRKHLNRQINENGRLKYVNNLVVLNSMFVSFEETPIQSIAV